MAEWRAEMRSNDSRDLIRARLMKYGIVSRNWAIEHTKRYGDIYNTILFMRKHGFNISTKRIRNDTVYQWDDFKVGADELESIPIDCIRNWAKGDESKNLARMLIIDYAKEHGKGVDLW